MRNQLVSLLFKSALATVFQEGVGGIGQSSEPINRT